MTSAWSLSRKVSAALLAILLCTMAATAFFVYSKYESVLSSLVESRYSVQLHAIKRNVEDRLGLGFSLRELRPVQDAIEREKSADIRILGIEVFDAKGEILFDTDRSAVGTAVAPEWLGSAELGGSQPFAADDDDARVVGLPLINRLGHVEGGVVLRYPEAYLTRELSPILRELGRQGVVLLVVFAGVAVAGSSILFKTVSRRLTAMETMLAKVMTEGGQADVEAAGDAFERSYAEFITKTREVLDHVQEASQDVERLDRLEKQT